MNIKDCIDIAVKEIGFPNTKEKEEKLSKRLHELLILKDLVV